MFHCSEQHGPMRWQLQCAKGQPPEYFQSGHTLGFSCDGGRMGLEH